MPGGRRAGAGRKTEHSEKAKEALFHEAVVAFQDQAAKDLGAIYQALRDAATGHKVLCKVEQKGGRRVLMEGDGEFEDSRGQPVWIYTAPPNPAALKIFVEHVKGRAATQPQMEMDTTINLLHRVPRPAGTEKPRSHRAQVRANIDAERARRGR